MQESNDRGPERVTLVCTAGMFIVFGAIVAKGCPDPEANPICTYYCLEGACCVDWNEDGEMNADDLSDYVSDYFNNLPCADLNLDNKIDEKDLALYLKRYFEDVDPH